MEIRNIQVNIKEVDWREASKFLAIIMPEEEANNSEIKEYIPKRYSNNGPSPTLSYLVNDWVEIKGEKEKETPSSTVRKWGYDKNACPVSSDNSSPSPTGDTGGSPSRLPSSSVSTLSTSSSPLAS